MKSINNLFNPFPVLKTERCILAAITEKNQGKVFQIYSNPEVMKYMQRNPIKGVDEALELIHKWNQLLVDNKGIRWGVFLKTSPNILIGSIALQYWNKNAKSIELGADLQKEYWGKGLAFEFTQPAIDFAFNKLELNRVELRCNPGNMASKRIAEKFGFSFEGTLREYVYIDGKGYDDESVYSLLRSEYLENKE